MSLTSMACLSAFFRTCRIRTKTFLRLIGARVESVTGFYGLGDLVYLWRRSIAAMLFKESLFFRVFSDGG